MHKISQISKQRWQLSGFLCSIVIGFTGNQKSPSFTITTFRSGRLFWIYRNCFKSQNAKIKDLITFLSFELQVSIRFEIFRQNCINKRRAKFEYCHRYKGCGEQFSLYWWTHCIMLLIHPNLVEPNFVFPHFVEFFCPFFVDPHFVECPIW